MEVSFLILSLSLSLYFSHTMRIHDTHIELSEGHQHGHTHKHTYTYTHTHTHTNTMPELRAELREGNSVAVFILEGVAGLILDKFIVVFKRLAPCLLHA
jgi:ABC-type nickel/cobalt efflux system permease component RcnA